MRKIRVDESRLPTYVQWAVLHYLYPERFSFRHLADVEGPHFPTIQNNVDFVTDHLNPTKIFQAFQNTANLILEAKSAS